MILILSTDNQESSTEEVMDWLNYNGSKFIRLNGEAFENNPIKVTLSDDDYFGIKNVELKDIAVIWNRRWWRTDSLDKIFKSNIAVKNVFYLHKYLKNEYDHFSKYLFHVLKHKNWIDEKSVIDSFNKLITLSIAKEIGIKIPNTIVTNDIATLKDFFSKNKRVITK